MISCPSEKQLQQWLSGDLSEAENQAIEAHVETCRDVCQPLLDSFSGFEDVPPANAGETPAPESADFPKLPGYEILGQLGKGGMGVVYKARHRRMDRLVAIKVLPPSLVQDAAAVARFEREVKAAARLQHPNIVAAYDAAEADGVHFLVMEYVAGIDLAALVRHKGPLPIGQAADFVLQAARGLDYAHRHGIVHRDIKPGNLLVDGEGVVKVLDMGLARFELAQDAGLTELTGMGQIMGTVDYMAPEQALDTHRADGRADIYALGLTLWYLLTGRAAYLGENALARLLAHREQPIPSLRGARPEVSPELEAFFIRMVAKQPEDRPQTMTEVIAELGRAGIAHQEPHEGRRVGIAHHANQPISASPKTSPHAIAVVDGDGGQCPPYAPTLALNAAQLDTDPNTEQSLAISLAPAPPRRRGPRRNMLIGAALTGLLAMAAAAAFVIRVQTGEGEIVVESEADGISVDILRNGEPIKEDWQIHAGADNRWVVRTGTVEAKLPANLQGEFTLDQDTARLVRDGKVLVKITRKTRAAQPVLSSEDPNRAVAEWVLNHGGHVAVQSPDRGMPAVGAAKGSELPDGPFVFWTIDITQLTSPLDLEDELIAQLRNVRGGLNRLGIEGITDAGLSALTKITALAGLESLWIGRAAITDAGLERLTAFPRLRHLDLTRTGASDSHLAALRGLPLETLNLNRNGEITDSGMRDVATIHGLRNLNIAETQVTDAGLAHLRELPLEMLDLGFDHVGDGGVAKLSGMHTLRHLILWSTQVGDEGLRSLRGLSELEYFDVTGTKVSGDGLGIVPGFRKLKMLSVVHTPVTDELLAKFCDLPELAELRLGGEQMKVSVAGLSALRQLTNLRTLYLAENSRVTDDWLEPLTKISTMIELHLTGTKITSHGVEKLHAALPHCRIISAHGTIEPLKSEQPQVPHASAADRDRAAAEWVLAQGGKVGYRVQLPSTEWGWLTEREKLPSQPFMLTGVNLDGVKRVRDTDLDRFVGLANQYDLGLGGTDVGAAALARIAAMPRLSQLRLNGTRVKSSELTALAGLPRLSAIHFSPEQNDDGWRGLASLSHLRQLWLLGKVAPDDLRRLGELQQLRTVLLTSMSQVDEAAVADLQASNPLCRVFVYDKAFKPVGRDPVALLAKRLLGKLAEVKLSVVEGSGVIEARAPDLAAGVPVNITTITLPPGVSLTDEEIELLDAPAALGWFGAGESTGADRYAAALAHQTSLGGIGLWQSDLTDAGLEHLKHLPSLESLDVQGTKVTRAGVEALRKALPDCKILWDSQTPPDAPVADRDRAAAEWVLAQGGKVTVMQNGTQTFVDRPGDLPAGKFSLYTVVLYGLRQVQNADLERFAGLDDIWDLHVANTPIGNDAVPGITRVRGLEQLKLAATRVTTSALAGLRDPIGELARRLRQKKAALRVSYLPEGSAADVKTDADIAPGKAFNIAAITLPPAAALDDEELS